MPEERGSLPLAERVRRGGRTGAAIAKIYLGYKGLDLLERRAPDDWTAQARRRWDETSARTLQDVSMSLGGLLIKAGQFLGARPDVLPKPYARRLSRLQDRVPPNPFRVVRRVLEEDLGCSPDALFSRIWRRPIASASLAQVHRATLHDGRDVAVKVQRPDVAAVIEADLQNLRLAVSAFERLETRASAGLGLAELLGQLEVSIPRELDFAREAAAALRMRENFAGRAGVYIPEVVPEIIGPRVLTTAFVPGIKVTDRRRLDRARIDRHALVARLVQAYAAQILEHGYFHADPHPGNLLAIPPEGGDREDVTLAFVDFGLTEELDAGFRLGLLALGPPLVSGDVAAVARALEPLGLEAGGRLRTRVASTLVEFVRQRRGGEGPAGQGGDRGLLDRLAEIGQEHPELHIPGRLWLLARVIGLIWGIAASLSVAVDPFGALAGASKGTRTS